jgi:hypothetical protein
MADRWVAERNEGVVPDASQSATPYYQPKQEPSLADRLGEAGVAQLVTRYADCGVDLRECGMTRVARGTQRVEAPTAQASRTKIVHSFGRTDQVDPAAIERLVGPLSRLLDPTGAGARRPVSARDAELTMRELRPLGGTHVLDGLWRRLGLDTVMAKLLVGSRRDQRVELVLFALVANRALDASSKLAAAGGCAATCTSTGWPRPLTTPATGDGLADRDRAKAGEAGVLAGRDPARPEVDLLFIDTTSTYFEIDSADEPVTRDERGWLAPEPAQRSAAGPGRVGDGDSKEAILASERHIGRRWAGKRRTTRRPS